MNAEHVDSAICERFRPELFAGSTALERKGAHGGVRTTELSDFGVWTVYAQQVEAVVGTVDDPTSVSYQLDAIASAASADVSLTEEERDAVYNLCSFGTSSSGYWNYYLASVNGGTPIPSVGRQLVAIDVGGAITAMRGAKSPWALLGGASLASAAGLVAKLINGELQVQTPVYDICQDHPGAC